MGMITILLCLCLLLQPCQALAVTTADAVEPISTEESCVLALTYGYDTVTFAGIPVKLYQIAAASADAYYTLTPNFASTGLTVNGVQSNAEWNIMRTTLEAHILSRAIQADGEGTTDEVGQVCFENLKPGLYLAVPGDAVWEDQTCVFASAIVALPGLDGEGHWQYRVAARAKGEILPPVDADEEIRYKVLKLWKGDGSGSARPKTVEVEIFRDGKSWEKVTLSEDNQWSYSWTVKKDGATWSVSEPNVPSGYKMTLDKRAETFILTNTRTTYSQTDTPKTGDTFNMGLHLGIMYVSGTLLILLGTAGKRKRV